jgi:hypothetical protein
MSKFTFRMSAGPHTRFTDDAARSLIGQRPRLNARESEGGPELADFGQGTVVAAEVVDDGAAMMVTVESDDVPRPDLLPDSLPSMSFGFHADR